MSNFKGKGSWQRNINDRKKFDQNYDAIFKKTDKSIVEEVEEEHCYYFRRNKVATAIPLEDFVGTESALREMIENKIIWNESFLGILNTTTNCPLTLKDRTDILIAGLYIREEIF